MILKNILIWLAIVLTAMYVIVLCIIQSPKASVSKPTQAYAYKTYPLLKQNDELFKEGSLTLDAAQTIKKNAQLILQHAPLNDDALLHLSLAGYLDSGFFENPNILKAAMDRNDSQLQIQAITNLF